MALLKQSYLWIHVHSFSKFLGIYLFSNSKNMPIAYALNKKKFFFKILFTNTRNTTIFSMKMIAFITLLDLFTEIRLNVEPFLLYSPPAGAGHQVALLIFSQIKNRHMTKCQIHEVPHHIDQKDYLLTHCKISASRWQL